MPNDLAFATGSAQCAHLRVSYRTAQVEFGLTHGWWACDSCNWGFAPQQRPGSPKPARSAEPVATWDALRKAVDNVLLAFHEWPGYTSDDADDERHGALEALVEARAQNSDFGTDRGTTPEKEV